MLPDSAVDKVVGRGTEDEEEDLGRDSRIRWDGCDDGCEEEEECDEVVEALVVDVTDDGDTSFPFGKGLLLLVPRPWWVVLVEALPSPFERGLPGLPVPACCCCCCCCCQAATSLNDSPSAVSGGRLVSANGLRPASARYPSVGCQGMAVSWFTKGFTPALTNGSFDDPDGEDEDEDVVLGDPLEEVLGDERGEGEEGGMDSDGATNEGGLEGLPGAAGKSEGVFVLVLVLVESTLPVLFAVVLICVVILASLVELASRGGDEDVVSLTTNCGEAALLLLWAIKVEREGWSADRRICMSSASFFIINSC